MKIEKGIPIPPQKRVGKNKQILSRMEISDSILLNCKSSGSGAIQALRVAANSMGIKIAARQCDEGVRVWRVR